MNKFLDLNFSSLLAGLQAYAPDVFTDAVISKDNMDLLLQRLTGGTSNIFVATSLASEPYAGKISSDRMLSNFVSAQRALENMYTVSGYVAYLLTALAQVLGAEVAALEDDLRRMEAQAKSYGFMMADNAQYDYLYIEPFTNTEILDFVIPDRGNQVFSDSETVSFDPSEDCIALTPPIVDPIPLYASVINSNAALLESSSTDLADSTLPSSNTGWAVTVDSITPLRTSLDGFDSTGAQYVVQYDLVTPSPCSQVTLQPLASNPVEIANIIVYASDDDATAYSVLSAPVTISQSYTLHFPIRSVSRFRVYVGQSVYTREFEDPYDGETRYAKLKDYIDATRTPELDYGNSLLRPPLPAETAQQKVQLSNTRLNTIGLPLQSFNSYHGPLSLTETLKDISNRNTDQRWSIVSDLVTQIYPMAIQQVPDIAQAFKDNAGLYQNITSTLDFYGPTPASVTPTDSGFAISQNRKYFYRYELGLLYVAIGIGDPNYKGAFISDRFTAPGDLGDVRLSTSEDNYVDSGSDLDNPILTSVEYSVTNVSQPQIESNWIPILPVGTSSVVSERGFPDTSGNIVFRFAPDLTQPISVFKNGYHTEFVATLTGVTVPVGTYSPMDIFTVSYAPAEDCTMVSFPGFDVPSLLASFDQDGAGDGFAGTDQQNMVQLAYNPYVDPAQVSTSLYYPASGLVPYQPITVILSNGVVPINLTNYTGGLSASLPAPTPGVYYYLHSNNLLTFNQPIDQPFRVYYQHLYNATRVRAVLRCNSDVYVSPKVNVIQLKGKSRSSNPLQSI